MAIPDLPGSAYSPDSPDSPGVRETGPVTGVTVLSREYPPNVYGGAGVHVGSLSRALAGFIDVEVRYFGTGSADGNPRVRGYGPWADIKPRVGDRLWRVFDPLTTDVSMLADPITTPVVHAHTWYTFWAGMLAKKLYRAALVTTVHSLEPLRPWKEEQLGTGYAVSRWAEASGLEASDRVIAVSQQMKRDVLSCYRLDPDKVVVVHNGVDPDSFKPTERDDAVRGLGIEGRYVLFVGRVSRQKGILELVEAARSLPADVTCVLCATSADTPEFEHELEQAVAGNPRVKWVRRMVPREELVQLYSHAAVFVCPSIYEPFGIINLEAMACETPVVASAVGGITEVVADGETGLLVPPANPQELARAINRLLDEPDLARRMGVKGRQRVRAHFGWDRIARRTLDVYRQALAASAS